MKNSDQTTGIIMPNHIIADKKPSQQPVQPTHSRSYP
jgi:hypothetical protein